jgi:pimeloyl-ACP methyl ester carboxylesterase
MADRTLLVPGTQATNLLDQDGNRVYNAVRVNIGLTKLDLKDAENFVPLLSMEHAPGILEPVKTSLKPGREIRTGAVLKAPYDKFPGSFERWPYDWRCDLRHNGAKLLDKLFAEKPANGRWNLLGHSQGGLLIVTASKLLDDPARWESLVARVALLGSPLAGTMRATDALVFGSEELGRTEQGAARTLSRTWPALYQMLPSWDAILAADNQPLPTGSQLLQLGGWPDPAGVSEDFLQRARDLQAMLRNPASRMGGSKAVFIMTSNMPTKVSMVRRTAEGADVFESFVLETGDSLCPFGRTQTWGGDAFLPLVLHVLGNVPMHAFLGIDEEIANFVKEFFKKP